VKHIKLTLALILIPLATGTLLHGGENQETPIEKLRQAASPNEQPASPEFTTPPETALHTLEAIAGEKKETKKDVAVGPDAPIPAAHAILAVEKKEERSTYSLLYQFYLDTLETILTNKTTQYIVGGLAITAATAAYVTLKGVAKDFGIHIPTLPSANPTPRTDK
jgi:hypothetical protein